MACGRGRGGMTSCPRRSADDDCEKKNRLTAVPKVFFHFRSGPRSLKSGGLKLGLEPAKPEATLYLASGRCGGDVGDGLQPVDLGWLILGIDDLLDVRYVLLAVVESLFNKTSDRKHTRRVEESFTMRNCLL
jgi:hypothetical protein